MSLLPKYFELLWDAQEASAAVDSYDLDSKNPVSVGIWRSLLANQHHTSMALMLYVETNCGALVAELDT